MCHALFLGSSKALPLVSFKKGAAFGIEDLAARHESIRRHFPSGWNVYFLNSHEGCGCGFHSDPAFADQDDELEKSRESRRCLGEYLSETLTDPNVSLALFDCWEGDEEVSIEHRARSTPQEISASYDPVLRWLRPVSTRQEVGPGPVNSMASRSCEAANQLGLHNGGHLEDGLQVVPKTYIARSALSTATGWPLG